MEKKVGKKINETPLTSELFEAYHKFGELFSEKLHEILDLQSKIIFTTKSEKKEDSSQKTDHSTSNSEEK